MRPSAADKARLRWVFLGPQGIRAGWSLLIFATLMTPLAFITSIVWRDYPSLFTGEIAPGISLLIEAVQVFFIVGAMRPGTGHNPFSTARRKAGISCKGICSALARWAPL